MTSESVAPSSPSDSKKPRSRKLQLLVVVLGILVVCGGVGVWWTSRVGDQNNTPIVLAESNQWEDYGKIQRYMSNAVNTKETYTPEVRAAIRTLEEDLVELDRQWREKDQTIRAENPHLAKALRDPLGTPLIGPNGARTVNDSLAGNMQVVELYTGRFSEHCTLPDEAKRRNLELLRPVLIGMLCGGGSYQVPFESLRDEYQRGNRDPLLAYTLMLGDTPGSDRRFELFMDAIELFEMRPTCSLLRALVLSKASEFRSRWSETEIVEYQERATDAFFAAVAEHPSDAAAMEMLRANGLRIFHSMNGAARGDLIIRMVALPPEKFPMWLRHYLAYSFSIEIADYYRGTNFISDVAAENLKIFSLLSEAAAKHLVRCWILNPMCGDVIAELVNLESRTGDTPYSRLEWFRIGIANTCDEEELYSQLSDKLVPKWGGSREELLQMISLCTAVRYKDLQIPYYATHFLWNSISERSLQLRLTDDLELLKGVLEMLDYARNCKSKENSALAGGRLGLITRVLWDWGRLTDLDYLFRNHLDGFSGNKWLSYYYLNMPLVYRVTGKASEGDFHLWFMLHDDLLINNDRLNEKIVAHDREIIETLRARHGGAEHAAWVLDYCERLCDWWTTFHSGEPVSLSADNRMLGWNSFVPNPPNFIENGFEFSAYYSSASMIMYPILRFPRPHAIEVEVELINGTDDFYSCALFAGPVGGDCVDQDFCGASLRYQPTLKQVIVDSLPSFPLSTNNPFRKSYVYKEAGKTKLRLEVRDDGLKGFVGEYRLEEVERQMDTRGFVQFGRFNSQMKIDDRLPVSYRVTNLKVISLDESLRRPAPTEEEK